MKVQDLGLKSVWSTCNSSQTWDQLQVAQKDETGNQRSLNVAQISAQAKSTQINCNAKSLDEYRKRVLGLNITKIKM